METIIGREKEQETLKNCFESNEAELIAVYGRRRVGKTFPPENQDEKSTLPHDGNDLRT